MVITSLLLTEIRVKELGRIGFSGEDQAPGRDVWRIWNMAKLRRKEISKD